MTKATAPPCNSATLQLCPGLPRTQYRRTVHVLPQDATFQDYLNIAAETYVQRQTIGFSHDDAGIGALSDKTAVLWNIPPADRQRYTNWYATHYPGTAVQFETLDSGSVTQPSGCGLFVDLSHHQGAVDWTQMKAAGVTHAYIRCTYGTGFIDSHCAANVAGARQAGIAYGLYHFFLYHLTGSAQAHYFLNAAQSMADSTLSLSKGCLPPAVDVENTDQIAALNPDQLRTCLSLIESHTGRMPVIYTNQASWNQLPTPQPWAARHPLWVAHWTSAPDPLLPRDWTTYWLWQYGQTNGRPFGVQSAQIDLNRFKNPVGALREAPNNSSNIHDAVAVRAFTD